MPPSLNTGFYARLRQHIAFLYPDANPDLLVGQLVAVFDGSHQRVPLPEAEPWSEADCLLITYGDSIRSVQDSDEVPLATLKRFLDDYVADAISAVHILPFCPYSSDDGFAVIDYTAIDDSLGGWNEIAAIGDRYRIMADLVINHVSSESQWFRNYIAGEQPGADWFKEGSPDDDLSEVVRPRASPLLRPTETADGLKHVWCTFSHDQIDLDFSNPQVLIEFVRIIRLYLQNGVRLFRLDAVGFLWKEVGTNCMHLPQTHEAVRLIRCLTDYFAPGTVLITETNVPHHENVTYFGNSNEAHVIYNFSLAPLLVHSLLTGKTEYIKRWLMSMPPAPPNCTYLNFTASHDGIGMRPAEGLLSDDEQTQLIETVRRFGGRVSTREVSPGVERAYELNISLIDAMKGTVEGEDEWQLDRFLCSQTVMLGLEGIPAFYIHSLLGTRNDNEGVERTGHNRSINRHKWDDAALRQELDDARSPHSIVLTELVRRVKLRVQQTAFHPSATQFVLQLQESLFAFVRESRDKSQLVYCVHNMTSDSQVLRLSELRLSHGTWHVDLLTDTPITDTNASFTLQPYQCLWITVPQEQ